MDMVQDFKFRWRTIINFQNVLGISIVLKHIYKTDNHKTIKHHKFFSAVF